MSKRVKRIEIGGPSLNFDYAHFLPSSPKCGLLHGHTSTVTVRVVGEVVDDMVLEFGSFKEIVKKVIDEMDHRLIVSSKYIMDDDGNSYRIVFNGVGGLYDLKVPREAIYVIEKDSTVENISEHIVKRLQQYMPANILKISVRMTEGLGKSAISEL